MPQTGQGGKGFALGSNCDIGGETPENGRETTYRPSAHFDIQRTAKTLLWHCGMDWKGQHRISGCCWNVSGDGVTIYRAKDGSRARFGGVVTCGSVWACVICAQRISQTRRKELRLGSSVAKAAGYTAYFMTLTHHHAAGQALKPMLEAQARAIKGFKGSKYFRSVWKRYGRLGSVRAQEVTVSVLNGWHPHTHELIYAADGLLNEDDTIADKAAVRMLKRGWFRHCLKQNLVKTDGTLKPIRDHWRNALDLRGGRRAADYTAGYGSDEHFGIEDEMTAGARKPGRRKAQWLAGMHFTPWQLVEWAKGGDPEAGAMFREYTDAFEGRRQLTWTPGLKAALGIKDLSDAEIAEQLNEPKRPDEEVVVRITLDQWSDLLKRSRIVIAGVRADSRAHLLAMAKLYGEEGVNAFFSELAEIEPTAKGYYSNRVGWRGSG